MMSSDLYSSVVLVCFVALVVHPPDLVTASWWQLGLRELIPQQSAAACRRLPFLVDQQQRLCALGDNVLLVMGAGARVGLEECQHQFRHSRWNCSATLGTISGIGGPTSGNHLFGGALAAGTREAAFIYAASSAGAAYAVTRACSSGELNECSCDHRARARRPNNKWQWGGCSEDIRFGETFSREFVDAREDASTPQGLMNLHNNEAGRRSIRARMKRVCKCHGMSGSCSMRVCWRRLPPFRELGDELAARYEGATRVRAFERKRRHGGRGPPKKLRAARPDVKPPNRTDLVFLDDAPDYCERNESLGVLGTHGRQCNATSPGPDGCRLLCCGRGYQTTLRDVEEKCHCRFFWCCKVECDTCKSRQEDHRCN